MQPSFRPLTHSSHTLYQSSANSIIHLLIPIVTHSSAHTHSSTRAWISSMMLPYVQSIVHLLIQQFILICAHPLRQQAQMAKQDQPRSYTAVSFYCSTALTSIATSYIHHFFNQCGTYRMMGEALLCQQPKNLSYIFLKALLHFQRSKLKTSVVKNLKLYTIHRSPPQALGQHFAPAREEIGYK